MKKPVILLFHIGYWFLYSLLMLLLLGLLTRGEMVGLATDPVVSPARMKIYLAAFTFVPAIFGFYLFYTVLFDHFLSRRKILFLFISSGGTIFLSGFMGALSLVILSKLGIGYSPFRQDIGTSISIVTFLAIIALPNGGMGLLLRAFIRWYDELKLKEDLLKKNFETELALVKSQLDPHFLFNTLNNIDALIMKDATIASDYLNKLSDIMRFMLYETKGARIPLSKEWNYIEKYIDLQKIRTANKDFVDLKIDGNTEGVHIAPMVLIPFVENAFKHAERLRTGNAVFVSAAIKKDVLQFECKNRFNPDDNAEKETGGLGNALIIKRLELLYPQKHTLRIEQKENVYHVFLTIELS